MPEPRPRHARAAAADAADGGPEGSGADADSLIFASVHDTGDLPAVTPTASPPPVVAATPTAAPPLDTVPPLGTAPPLDTVPPLGTAPPLDTVPPTAAAPSAPGIPPELARLRASIDNFDAALVHLLAERFKCTQRVGVLKAEANLPPSDPAREAEQIARLRALAVEAGLDPVFAEKFVTFIVAEVIRHHEEIAAAGG